LPGNTPGEAVSAFLDPIKLALGSIGSPHIQYRDHPPIGKLQAATLNNSEPYRLASDLHGHLFIEMTLQYYVIEDEGQMGPYRCTSAGYALGLADDQHKEMVSYHWHPNSESPEIKPHFHVGEGYMRQQGRLHVPAPRVTVEQFIETLVDSFGVQPASDDWREMLAYTRGVHEEWRTWGEHGETPTEDALPRPRGEVRSEVAG
jgi:hypothetical protein